ncbi:hypothetical protein [Actinokineospora sp. NBRC 105648]|uniref:hypothetical protein n=1 Tax=Actinokineospora sp. NBRC 105648 TaxID=3032206 RepID=UPI002556E825|nr:hypothetical protein [Actinokineospora sp. NBRC 105648]
MCTPPEIISGRSLVSDRLFAKLVEHHMRAHNVRQPRAETVIDQTLAFLCTLATTRGGEPLEPGPVVYAGWHTFLVHTTDYAEFCRAFAGRFLHHKPWCLPQSGEAALRRTSRAMAAAGFVINPGLWP